MKKISTVIIGAGQAGLATSFCLAERAIPHVVLERGEVAQSWRTQRWDSLRLLTPNWQSRLPGFSYSGNEPDGYMSMAETIKFFEAYASLSKAPVEERTEVLKVARDGNHYRVETSRGIWQCENVVIASGACSRPVIPGFAGGIPGEITQVSALDYKNPDQLPNGGVLVVGASASGMQLALELARSGRAVTLSVGQHIRLPRRYRGQDIQWWMDRSGILHDGLEDADDIDRARRVPSLQLAGSSEIQMLDINFLQTEGIEIAGRFAGVADGRAMFSGSLANQCALSDLKMNRTLSRIDDWIEATGLAPGTVPERYPETGVADPAALTCDLNSGRFRTVLWATGFAPDFRYLDLPVFDRKMRLQYSAGEVAPGRLKEEKRHEYPKSAQRIDQ